MVNSTIRLGPVWYVVLFLHEGLALLLWPYHTLFLMVRSESRWNSIVKSERSFSRTLCLFFLPMILTLFCLEGWGLKRWARWYDATGLSRSLTTNDSLALESLRCLMLLLAMMMCAHIIKVFCVTFRNRNTFQQAFTVIIYSFAPFCLIRALLVFYPFNDWVLWGFGVVLALKVLYHGLPRIMQPDSPQALGLFFMGALSVCLITLLERFITLCYLCKFCRPPSLI